MAKQSVRPSVQDSLDSSETRPLLEILNDSSTDMRVSAFEALTRMPLSPADWETVGDYAMQALDSIGSSADRLAVIRNSPWIPLRRVRTSTIQLAADDDARVRGEIYRSLQLDVEVAVDSQLHPVWAGRAGPPGFTICSSDERALAKDRVQALRRTGELERPYDARGPSDPLFSFNPVALAPLVQQGLAPAVVTVLFEEAAIGVGNEIVGWLEHLQGTFAPDLEGLFNAYKDSVAQEHAWRGLEAVGFWFLSSPDDESGYRGLAWQIAWTVSRGGLRGLVSALAGHLTAQDPAERMSAIFLIADAADYAVKPDAPYFGGGAAPVRRVTSETLVDDPGSTLSPMIDDLVRTAIRAAVSPGLVAFNPPTELRQGRRVRIEVRIARSHDLLSSLTKGLRGAGLPQIDDIETTAFMAVGLKGETFEVIPLSEPDQLVVPGRVTHWEFDVRPLRSGLRTLSLIVTARVPLPSRGDERFSVPAYERDIKVRVDPLYGFRHFVVNYWQWLVTTVLGLGAALAAWIKLFLRV